MLPLAEATLNLLRSSHINPALSVYCQVWGNFDFTKIPLAPAGTRLFVRLKRQIRETWVLRATKGWYLGSAMRHYRVWIFEKKLKVLPILSPDSLHMSPC